ncbi:MAG TPA: methyltransferase domain-containing protein [Anaerolineales bacterium]|nr:methyltransferase domain-containing protein [Anaerolineales bacterium]
MKDPYQLTAKWYDNLFEPINKGLRLIGLRMFLPKAGMNILDVGCGTGAFLAFYQRYKCNLYGIDMSPAMMTIARERLGTGVNLHLGSAADMPYEDDFFDFVVSMLVLHEMDPPLRLEVLGEINRVLKPGGRVLLIDFNPGRPESFEGWRAKATILLSEIAAGRRHFRNYRQFMSIGGLSDLVEAAGFAVVKQKIVAGGPLTLILVERKT